MGISDRDWNLKDQQRNPLLQGRGDLAVKILVGLNASIFLAGMFTSQSVIVQYCSFSVYQAIELGQWWRWLTCQFIHQDIGHILFNMIALWVFGRPLNHLVGNLRFTIGYLLCGIAGAILSTILLLSGIVMGDVPLIHAIHTPMLGASGAIYGCIAGCAVLFPTVRIRLLIPPVELSMRTFALIVLGIALVFVAFDWNNSGGEAAHLGGAIFGGILAWLLIFTRKSKQSAANRPLKIHLSRSRSSAQSGYTELDRLPKTSTPEEIDRILEKINRTGIHSLSPDEIKRLKDFSKNQ